MNKYLSEIEIIASNLFGEEKARLFNDETRKLVEAANSFLKRNIISHYGKIAVNLMPQKTIEEYAIPVCQLNSIAGVCVVNRPYELDDYFATEDANARRAIVYTIFCDSVAACSSDVGLDKQAVYALLKQVFEDGNSGDSLLNS